MEEIMSEYSEIEPRQLAAELAAGEGWTLVDVREDHELQIAAVEGFKHIPMGEIPAGAAALDKSARYAIMCHGGVRSAQVCHYLVNNGFDKVSNIVGGIDLWSQQVNDQIPRY